MTCEIMSVHFANIFDILASGEGRKSCDNLYLKQIDKAQVDIACIRQDLEAYLASSTMTLHYAIQS
jgi:hypothetical protein